MRDYQKATDRGVPSLRGRMSMVNELPQLPLRLYEGHEVYKRLGRIAHPTK